MILYELAVPFLDPSVTGLEQAKKTIFINLGDNINI